MTHQEKVIIFHGSGDEDVLTLSPIYCDVIARVKNYNLDQSSVVFLQKYFIKLFVAIYCDVIARVKNYNLDQSSVVFLQKYFIKLFMTRKNTYNNHFDEGTLTEGQNK